VHVRNIPVSLSLLLLDLVIFFDFHINVEVLVLSTEYVRAQSP
jgi:hypothetical protein